MRVATDTATLAVFDPALLRHRLPDPCDWWSIREWCVADMNQGNLLVLKLGADGVYEVVIHLDADRPESEGNCIAGVVACDSGKLYIGPGEQISGEGLEPDESFGGIYLPTPVGVFRVRCKRDEDTVEMWLEPVSIPARNQFADYLRL